MNEGYSKAMLDDVVTDDNGIGISEDVIERIFDEFVMADESRKTDGVSGLGLAITKKIIDLSITL